MSKRESIGLRPALALDVFLRVTAVLGGLGLLSRLPLFPPPLAMLEAPVQ